MDYTCWGVTYLLFS